MSLSCILPNRHRYAASWTKETMIWEIGITIHVSAESQRFPNARWRLGKRSNKGGGAERQSTALTGAPSLLYKCVDYVKPSRLRERWLEHFLRQWPDWKVTSCHLPYPWRAVTGWLPVHSDGYVESQASKQRFALQSHRPPLWSLYMNWM